jgi:predicted lipoprotein with Yx(FWY)xxD motif
VTLVAVTVLAGCTAGSSASHRETPAPAAPSTSLRVRTVGLFAVDTKGLGTLVIDGGGFVLYRYDKDSAKPSKSTCVDGCTRTWLPVPANPELRVAGIDRQLVGELVRPDGTMQLTLAGWPLYGYSGDRMPGETNGQGVDGAWFAISPSGGKAS